MLTNEKVIFSIIKTAINKHVVKIKRVRYTNRTLVKLSQLYRVMKLQLDILIEIFPNE